MEHCALFTGDSRQHSVHREVTYDARAVPFTAGEIRISYDDLVADVRETYAIYESVLAGERDKKRRSGGSGSLL